MNDETTAMTSLSAVQFGSDRLLPFDIVKAIFSFIEQSDCLECMLVSHSWYQAVPQYASLIWETVNFTKSKVDTERFWMCLGPHVRHVVLKDDIYFILYKLIQHHCCNIESIKFNRCKEISRFAPQIQQLTTALAQLSPRELDFHKIQCDIPIMEILAACSKLNQFSYSFGKAFRPHRGESDGDWNDPPKVLPSSSMDHQSHINGHAPSKLIHLTSLCLDVRMDEFVSIVKLCPNLVYLHLWLQWPGLLNLDINTADLEHIFKICPRLEELYCYWPDKEEPSRYHWRWVSNSNSNISHSNQNGNNNNNNNNNNNSNPLILSSSKATLSSSSTTTIKNTQKPKGHLKAFASSVVLGHGAKDILHVLRQNQTTLQCVKIENYDLNSNNIMGDFEFAPPLPSTDDTHQEWQHLATLYIDQLVELSTRDLPWKSNTLAKFLSRSPRLTYLSLQNLDPQILEKNINPAPQQQQLRGGGRGQRRRRNDNNRNNNHQYGNEDENELLLHEAFRMLPHLQSVELLLNSKLLTRTTTQRLCTFLQAISDTALHLEQLCVAGFNVLTDPLLEAAVTNNHHLRILRLGHGDTFRRNNRPTTEKGIHYFAEHLSRHIRFLDLTNLKLSSRALFEQLADRPDLDLLTLNSCGKSDEVGLRLFLTQKVASLNFLRMDSCHIEHRKGLVEYAKNELHYNIRENRNQLFVSRSI